MRLRTALLVMGVAIACAGCASTAGVPREPFEDPARIDSIVPGSMTRQQVRDLLGEPHDRAAVAGEETWTYRSYRGLPMAYVPFANAGTPSMQTLVVSIAFTGAGVVKDVGTEKRQW